MWVASSPGRYGAHALVMWEARCAPLVLYVYVLLVSLQQSSCIKGFPALDLMRKLGITVTEQNGPGQSGALLSDACFTMIHEAYPLQFHVKQL